MIVSAVWIKLLLVLALAVIPVHLILALPVVSPVAVIAVIGFWMVAPAWGAWIYAGVCANLVLWRIWLIWPSGSLPEYARYSPSLANQNSGSAWLGIGGIVGAIRSWYDGESAGVLIGLIVGVGLLIVQGVLFRADLLGPADVLRHGGHSGARPGDEEVK